MWTDAIQAAKEAYKSWRLTPPPKRGEILYRAARLLVERKEAYAEQMTREMGKILEETRGDVQEAIDMTYYMAGEGRRLFGQTTTSELPNKFCMWVRSPIGVCSLVTPWNFPMAIPILESHAGAHLRQYGSDEARHGHPALDVQPGSDAGRSRNSARGGEPRYGKRRPKSELL